MTAACSVKVRHAAAVPRLRFAPAGDRDQPCLQQRPGAGSRGPSGLGAGEPSSFGRYSSQAILSISAPIRRRCVPAVRGRTRPGRRGRASPSRPPRSPGCGVVRRPCAEGSRECCSNTREDPRDSFLVRDPLPGAATRSRPIRTSPPTAAPSPAGGRARAGPCETSRAVVWNRVNASCSGCAARIAPRGSAPAPRRGRPTAGTSSSRVTMSDHSAWRSFARSMNGCCAAGDRIFTGTRGCRRGRRRPSWSACSSTSISGWARTGQWRKGTNRTDRSDFRGSKRFARASSSRASRSARLSTPSSRHQRMATRTAIPRPKNPALAQASTATARELPESFVSNGRKVPGMLDERREAGTPPFRLAVFEPHDRADAPPEY